MGILKRKQPATTTGHAGDDQTLAALANVGADLETPRLWEHFVYCEDEPGAAILETQAREAGWDASRFADDHHGIVASRTDRPVNPETVVAAREFFETLASAVPGGDYDGWGAEGG